MFISFQLTLFLFVNRIKVGTYHQTQSQLRVQDDFNSDSLRQHYRLQQALAMEEEDWVEGSPCHTWFYNQISEK